MVVTRLLRQVLADSHHPGLPGVDPDSRLQLDVLDFAKRLSNEATDGPEILISSTNFNDIL